jgi:hypothetical protein
MDASLSLSRTALNRNGRGGKRSMRLERLRAKRVVVELARPILQGEGWITVSLLYHITGLVQTTFRRRAFYLGDDFAFGEFRERVIFKHWPDSDIARQASKKEGPVQSGS